VGVDVPAAFRRDPRDDRIAEFHEVSETPVMGLREGGLSRVLHSEVDLAGASARLPIKGEKAFRRRSRRTDLVGRRLISQGS
jgi:hypothetical protein